MNQFEDSKQKMDRYGRSKQSHAIELLGERDITFTETKDSGIRALQAGMFSKVEVEKNAKKETVTKSLSFRMVTESLSSMDREKLENIDTEGQGTATDRLVKGLAPLDSGQDSQYLLNSGGMYLNLNSIKPAAVTECENTTERLLEPCKNISGIAHLPSTLGWSNGQQRERLLRDLDTDRASYTIIEELGQQIVKLSNTQRRLEEDKDKLSNRVQELEHEITSLREEKKKEHEKYKRDDEEKEKKRKKMIEVISETYENEMNVLREEINELTLKNNKLEIRLQQYQDASFNASLLKSKRGITPNHRVPFRVHDEDEDRENIDPNESSKSRVIVSPKPKSRSHEKVSASKRGFYYDYEGDNEDTSISTLVRSKDRRDGSTKVMKKREKSIKPKRNAGDESKSSNRSVLKKTSRSKKKTTTTTLRDIESRKGEYDISIKIHNIKKKGLDHMLTNISSKKLNLSSKLKKQIY